MNKCFSSISLTCLCMFAYLCTILNVSVSASETLINYQKDTSLSESNSKVPSKIINVPYINQNEIVYGCEVVSATMLLQYYQYSISEKDFTDNYLIQKD